MTAAAAAMTSTVVSVTTPHPFTRLQNPTRWEITRMFLGLVSGFVPLRLFVLMISIAIDVSLVVTLHHLGLRSLSVYCLRLTCRWLLLVLGHFNIPCNFETGNSDRNTNNNNDIFATGNCPNIIVSNHVSNTEILHLLTLPFRDDFGNPVLPVFVTKETIFGLPFIGTITRDVLGSIGVSRRTKQQQQQQGIDGCTEQICSRVRERTARSGPIVIFAEGTTTNGTCLLAFKRGAFAPLVAVQPVLYSFGKYAYKEQTSDFLPTYESIWGPAYLWRYLSQPVHEFSCRFLDPVAPNTASNSDNSNANINDNGGKNNEDDPSSVFAEHVRSEMARKGNLPMLAPEYNYRHKLEYHAGLTKAFLSYPKGLKHAMCFAPMQKVLPTMDSKSSGKEYPYDVVVGTKFVAEGGNSSGVDGLKADNGCESKMKDA